jgi:hypothetical protein
MDTRTKGAWIINHTRKIQDIRSSHDFENIELAGKCGVFLSNLAASDNQSDINAEKVGAIAKVSDIKKTEIDTIKQKLRENKLIDVGRDGSVTVLGLTTASVLNYTSSIFEYSNPSNLEKAAIDLSENVSDLPKDRAVVAEYISDTYSLSKQDTDELFNQSEEIGFVDFENLDSQHRLYFNGNLFKKESIQKTSIILSSLKPEESKKVTELDVLLSRQGCIEVEKCKSILGESLLAKLQAIGMYDFNEVSNSFETKTFVTKPAAFSKYGSPFEEDALDLAKTFVSALYYGMKHSSKGRGKITMLNALMRKLVNGFEVGPATAIGEDYQLLELRRVIKLRQDPSSTMFYMRLLKKDIGALALQVLETGDATEQIVAPQSMYTGAVTNYSGPEHKRQFNRRKQTSQSKKSVAELLRTFRS